MTRNCNRIVLSVFAILALTVQVKTSVAALLPIVNAGFEAPLLIDDNFTDDTIPGWEGTISGPNFNFGVYNPRASVFPGQAPEGLNVAYIQSGTIFQTLNEGFALGKYTLSVWVGDSLADPVSPFTVELRAGSVLVAQASSPIPADGLFTLVTLNYEAVEGAPGLGQLLQIRLIDNDLGQVTEPYFDDVRLDFEQKVPDFDMDGAVNGADLTRWRDNFGTGLTHMQGNADGDGDIDGRDFLIWQRHLGNPASNEAASALVPEPATALLLPAVSAGVAVHRRRRMRRAPTSSTRRF